VKTDALDIDADGLPLFRPDPVGAGERGGCPMER
jgi:hypothetical protein